MQQHSRAGLCIAAPLIVALLGIGGHHANAAEPVYQRLADAACRTVAEDPAGATQLCSGPDGTPFSVTDGDLRIAVVFGGVDETPPRRFESFGSFNHIGDTVEWRMEGGQATAAILRWYLEPDGGEEGQVLVVSKVGDDSPGCVVAYVDARANPSPNDLAREAADRIAPNVECGAHVPFYYGIRGPSAGDPMRSE
jgi:hypothetical protein